MQPRLVCGVICLAILCAAGWIGRAAPEIASEAWSEVLPGIWKTPGAPAGYALVDGDRALLIDAPTTLGPPGTRHIEAVFLTHHHRDTCSAAGAFLAKSIPVRAPKTSAEWLTPENVRKYWQESIPLLRDGDSATWREYHFRFHHFPGQSEFTMGVESTIDGKRCFFTADNFFHQDQFSGTGGWMGLNRSWPLPYSASAQKVLDSAPDWVLAEHGGPFEFSAEDFRRRVEWGRVSVPAADAISPSGNHRRDWDPNRIHVRPLLQKVRPGATMETVVVASNVTAQPEKVRLVMEGRGILANYSVEMQVAAGSCVERKLSLRVDERTPPGRHVFILRPEHGSAADGTDAFFAIDVEQ